MEEDEEKERDPRERKTLSEELPEIDGHHTVLLQSYVIKLELPGKRNCQLLWVGKWVYDKD